MSEPDLDAIKARCQAATPGPWYGANRKRKNGVGIVGAIAADGESAPVAILAGARFTIRDRTANTEFIAHARQDIPALIAEIERLREGL